MRNRPGISIAKIGVTARFLPTVCIWAHPVWCAFFGSTVDDELAWAGHIGLSAPSAVTGPRFPVARTGDWASLSKPSSAGTAGNCTTRS
jgi:hypothetical protein